MGNLHRINSAAPKKLKEVEWTEGGMRLSPVQRTIQNDWFWPAMLTLPLGAFLIIVFW